jgi:electron transfer flavoprotein beta subunit
MGAAHMSDITAVDVLGNTLLLTKEYEDCFIDYEAEMPCVIGVRKNINEVRYPTTWDILTAKDKPCTIFSKDDLPEIDDSLIGLAGSPTRAGDLHTPEYSREAVEITGNAEEIADQILKILETK